MSATVTDAQWRALASLAAFDHAIRIDDRLGSALAAKGLAIRSGKGCYKATDRGRMLIIGQPKRLIAAMEPRP